MARLSRDFFDLASLQEGFDVELKAARGRGGKGELPDSFWETYSTMANTEGGYVIFGAEETQNGVVFHDLPDHQKVIQDIWNSLNNPNKVSINLLQNRDVSSVSVEGKRVILIQIPQASRKQRPVYIGQNPLTGTYRRNNEGDYRCPSDLVKRMLGEQANDTCDAVILEHYGLDDLDNESFRIYRQ